MFMRKCGHAVLSAGAAATVAVAAPIALSITLAGCGANGTEKTSATPAYPVSIAVATKEPEGMHVLADAVDIADPLQPSLAEMRHYAVYNIYRALFDGPADESASAVHEGGGMPHDKGVRHLGDVLPACSARVILTQD